MEYKFIELTNIDGLRLRGTYNYSKVYEGEKLPTIIIFHGFTGNRYGNAFLYKELSRHLVDKGYGVYRFDFIGSGDSDGDFKDMTLTSEINDAMTIYNLIKNQRMVDKDNIFILGHSMGGFVATEVAKKINPRGLILLCPAIDMLELCEEYYKELNLKDIKSVNVEGLELNVGFLEDLRKYNGYESAAEYNGPVLMFRGKDDILVPKATMDRLKQVFTGYIMNIEIDDTGHCFEDYRIRQNMFITIEDFIYNEIN